MQIIDKLICADILLVRFYAPSMDILDKKLFLSFEKNEDR